MTILKHFRYSVRLYARNKVQSTVSILSVAIGIALTTVIFSVLNGMLLKPLQGEHADRLVRVGTTLEGDGFLNMSQADFLHIQDSTKVMDSVVAHYMSSLTMGTDDWASPVTAEFVSQGYFETLGVKPPLGSGFSRGGDQDAPLLEVIISDRLWKSRFQEDPNVIGKPVHLNGQSLTVVGVAPAGFRGTFFVLDMDLWVPLSTLRDLTHGDINLIDEKQEVLLAIGRLGEDRTIKEAEAEMRLLGTQINDLHGETDSNRSLRVVPATTMFPAMRGPITALMIALLVVASFVLLIAITNVANLQMALAVRRFSEFAVRRALGATRWHLLKQCLAEGFILSLVGGVVGLVLTYWATTALAGTVLNAGVDLYVDTSIDGRVLSFVLAAVCLAGMFFGLMPVLKLGKPRIQSHLKAGASQGMGRRRSLLQCGLVVVQVSTTVVLLYGALLMTQSLINSRSVDLGFNPDGVVIMDINPAHQGYEENRAVELQDSLVDRIAGLPSVESAFIGGWALMGSGGDRLQVAINGEDENSDLRSMPYNIVDSKYFEGLEIPLISGRGIEEYDRAGSQAVVVVNRTMSSRYWPDGNALGQRIQLANEPMDRIIVGVVEDSRYKFIGEPSRPYMFLPWGQVPQSNFTLHVRVTTGTQVAIPTILAVIRQVEPGLAPDNAGPMNQMRSVENLMVKMIGMILIAAGSLALFLAAIGLFSLLTFIVSQRMRELGIRVALGAPTRHIMRLVLRQGTVLTAVGLVIGLAMGWPVVRLLGNMLIDVQPHNPATIGAVCIGMILVTFAASYVPARRAAKADPLKVIREE